MIEKERLTTTVDVVALERLKAIATSYRRPVGDVIADLVRTQGDSLTAIYNKNRKSLGIPTQPTP